MNLKTALMALAMGCLVVAGTGCGNACDDLADAYAALDCGGGETTEETTESTVEEVECTDAQLTTAECLTPCVEAATCDDLGDLESEYYTCIADC